MFINLFIFSLIMTIMSYALGPVSSWLFIYSSFLPNRKFLTNKYISPKMSLNVLCLCLIVLAICVKHKITFAFLGDFTLNTMSYVLKDAKLIPTKHSKAFELLVKDIVINTIYASFCVYLQKTFLHVLWQHLNLFKNISQYVIHFFI